MATGQKTQQMKFPRDPLRKTFALNRVEKTFALNATKERCAKQRRDQARQLFIFIPHARSSW